MILPKFPHHPLIEWKVQKHPHIFLVIFTFIKVSNMLDQMQASIILCETIPIWELALFLFPCPLWYLIPCEILKTQSKDNSSIPCLSFNYYLHFWPSISRIWKSNKLWLKSISLHVLLPCHLPSLYLINIGRFTSNWGINSILVITLP
jgi:hypothetical protein